MKLSLPNVQLEDEGSYSCENQIGESEAIKITVTGKFYRLPIIYSL